jgi:hypothetical protein
MSKSSRASYFLVCENFIVDKSDRVSMVNVFDTVAGPKLPLIPLKFMVAFRVSLHPGDIKNGFAKIKIELIDESSDVSVLTMEGNAVAGDGSKAISSSFDLSGKISFPKEGPHKLRLLVGETELATTSFEVKIINQESEQ